MKFKSEILDSTSFNRVIKRIAHQIIEKNSDVQNIAIIGISGRYPKAKDLKEFWNNLCEGMDCIVENCH